MADSPSPAQRNWEINAVHGANEPAVREVVELRIKSWGPFPYVRPTSVEDAYERSAWHLLGRLEGLLVAAGRVTLHLNWDIPDGEVYPLTLRALRAPIASYNRLVVDPICRGLGLGTYIDNAAIAEARKRGAASLVCWTRFSFRMRALESLGFKPLGACAASAIPGNEAPMAYTYIALDEQVQGRLAPSQM